MNRKALINFIGFFLSAAYFLCFFYMVFLTGERKLLAKRYINIIPIKASLDHYHRLTPTDQPEIIGFYTNLYGNIALFIPFSIILLWMFRFSNKITVLFIAFLTSVLIECIQYLFEIGTADSDDVILNTMGAAIGILIYSIVEKITSRTNRRI